MYLGRLAQYDPLGRDAVRALNFSKEWRAELRDTQNSFTWIRNNPTLLEVACSTGQQLKEYMDEGAKVLGLDISRYSQYYARKRKLPFLIGDANRLPFEDHSFDIVTSTLFIHSIPYEQQIISLNEMLRVGKEVIIADYIPAVKHNILYPIIKDLELFEEEMMPGHLRNFQEYLIRGGMPQLIGEVEAVFEDGTLGPKGLVQILKLTKPF